MNSSAHPAAAHPTLFVTAYGEEITLRPMLPSDEEALLEFFCGLDDEDRFYLKDDVTSFIVINDWARNLNYSRTLPILAIVGGRIIGDATLHYERGGARCHIGDVRVAVDPQYRRRGLGRRLVSMLTEVARDDGLEKLMFEVVADTQETAKHIAQTLGFVPVAIVPDHVRDIWGKAHDLVIMELRLDRV